MRELLTIIGFGVLLVLSFAAQAQQRIYTFTLTQDETNLIFNQLTLMPWKDSNTLIQKLSAQAAAQNAPPGPSKAEMPKVETPKVDEKPAESKPEDKKPTP